MRPDHPFGIVHIAPWPDEPGAFSAYWDRENPPEMLEQSPYLETFRARGQDVLVLTDPIDEFMVPSLAIYKGKSLKAADRGELRQDGRVCRDLCRTRPDPK